MPGPDLPILSLLVVIPLVTAVALWPLRRLPARLSWWVALAGSGATLLAAGRLFLAFDPTRTGFQFVERHEWLPAFGVRYLVGVDGVSVLLLGLTAFLVPLALLSAWRSVGPGGRGFLALLLLLESAMIGVFVSLNLFLFYLFFELILVPMAFVIGIWGGERRVFAAVKFFVYTVVGSLLMLVAILVLYQLHQAQFGAPNLDLVGVGGRYGLFDTVVPTRGEAPWWQTQTWLFAAFALSFAIKVPIVPFHTWLPDAHVEAPTAGSVILAGILLKLGGYGFVRLALPLFPAAAVELAPLFLGLGLVGILYGSLVAWAQDDMKKLVAYSSVAHMGFVVLGLFSFNLEGLEGAVLQMVNHGLTSAGLFLLVGMLYERRHTHRIADFEGIARPMPVFATAMVIMAFASIGLPGTNGFVGELLILLGMWLAHPVLAAAGTLGVVLAAVYLLGLLRRVLFGPVESPVNRGLMDVGWREKLILVALLVPVFWIGVHPQTLLRRLDASVIEVLRRVEAGATRMPSAEAGSGADATGAAGASSRAEEGSE